MKNIESHIPHLFFRICFVLRSWGSSSGWGARRTKLGTRPEGGDSEGEFRIWIGKEENTRWTEEFSAFTQSLLAGNIPVRSADEALDLLLNPARMVA